MEAGVLWAISGLLVVVGLAGTILPGLPGAALVFGGLVLAAWIDRFERVGWLALTVMGLLTLLSFAADMAAASLGAKRMGASGWAVAGAAAGAVLGLLLGLPGVILGPFAGAVAGELLAKRDLAQAGRAGFGAWVGFLLGTVARLGLACSMVGVFVAAYLW